MGMIEGGMYGRLAFEASIGGTQDEIWSESIADIIEFREQVRATVQEAARQEQLIIMAALSRNRTGGHAKLEQADIDALQGLNDRVAQAQAKADEAVQRFKRGERPPKRDRKPLPPPRNKPHPVKPEKVSNALR